MKTLGASAKKTTKSADLTNSSKIGCEKKPLQRSKKRGSTASAKIAVKKSLKSLPKYKRQELQLLVELIHEKYPKGIAMIVLFGSYARGDWVEELHEDGHHYRYQSDFDIFVVTDYEHLATKIERDGQLRNSISHVLKTPVTIIAHDIDFFNRRLRKGQYFFGDVKKEGICLYDSGKFELAEEKELPPQERKKLAEEDFEYWFTNANNFFQDFQLVFQHERYNNAAFLLHQVTERLYSTVLLVLTRYKPSTHDLEKLSKWVASVEPAFLKAFPQGTDEEKRLFELLRKAYVDARYNKNYTIKPEELTWLSGRVEVLRDLTKEICRKKIENF